MLGFKGMRTGNKAVGQVFVILTVLLMCQDGFRTEDFFRATDLKNYQIVSPQLVRQRWGRNHSSRQEQHQDAQSDHLTYSITIDDITHLLILTRNKDFLSPGFTVVAHDVHRNTVKTHAEGPLQASCYYSGHVDGYEDSLVALSTCSGLRGVIFIGNRSYGLEPAFQSSNNEHLLFPLKDSQSEQFVCGQDEASPDGEAVFVGNPLRFITSLLRKKRNLPITRYVELALVVDYQRYKLNNNNMTAVREEMVQLANMVDTYYQQLNIRILLVGLMVFQNGNPFLVNGTANDVLRRFADWKKAHLNSVIRSDISQLIVGQGVYDGGILGMAYIGTVCSASTSCGINTFRDVSLHFLSLVLAHEMGHNLGMTHDDSRCQCAGGTCIMHSTATGSTLFSLCSANDFETLITNGGGVCLRNQPSQANVISVAQCGNGLLEGDEQCDCGSPQNCTNKCCNAATCTFSKGSNCAAGVCCSDCQLLVSGTPCRPSVDQCDLPEYCNGSSGFCPPDTYLMDGLTCQSGTAYCYEGRCQTLDYQCKQLFGPSALKANDLCYSYVNTEGTKYGNCGPSGSGYIPCSAANSMCGKLQCTNFDANNPPPNADISIETFNGGAITCKNADFNLGTDVLDPAYVKTGTVCNSGKICMNFQCVNSSALTQGQRCNAATDCNGLGVCNELSHCHCNNGWAPPNCTTRGRGGSEDSGPAEIDYTLRNGLLVFFLLVVPILVALCIILLYVFRRDSFNKCFRRSRRQRSQNTDNQPRNTNMQRPPVQTPVQAPPTNPQASLYQNASEARGRPVVWNSEPVRQGPGVPRPIPPRANAPVYNVTT